MAASSGRHFLQIPGPTNVPDRVLRAIDCPTIDHRGPAFGHLGREVLDGMKGIFRTSGPVVIYPSSGTGAWHVGEAPDQRATRTALQRGYDLSALRARKVLAEDFDCFHYMLAMDQQNLADLQQLCPVDFNGELNLFLDYASGPEREVPDPYYGAGDGSEYVLDLVENASQRLLKHIQSTHQL